MYLVNSEDNELNYFTRPVAVIKDSDEFMELVRRAHRFLAQNIATEMRLAYSEIKFVELESLPQELQEELMQKGVVEVDEIDAQMEERECYIVVTDCGYWIEAELNMSTFTFVPLREVWK